MGTFLNRVLKDIFVKVHLLDGKFAKFRPGWDMHGLPIEFETLKHLGLDFRKIDPIELRAKCRERALHWLDVQRTTFLRMGLLGDFDHPYRTIDKEFEAVIVEALADLAEADQLYKGLRSTLWCIHDETALAEAEIEYKDKVSPAIYVRFAANATQTEDILGRFGVRDTTGLPKRLSVVIWTTTPWTLPANVAIAVKPDAPYGLYANSGELYVVAEALEASVRAKAGLPEPAKLGSVLGDALIGASVRHPFLDRNSEIVGAAYVELETGTGAVHTAPGHGVDDFETGVQYGLPIINPVDGRGHFTAEAGPYAGLQIFKANDTIVEDLAASGALWASEPYAHSYPHCWRCKNPVIFRATAQWFLAMDVNRLRKRIEEKLPSVTFTPAWGQNRMRQMIENHPEWCLSRQRTWGTPIPAVVCGKCNESTLDPELARRVAARFREVGADAWWREDLATFLPENFSCPKCRGTTFEKELNIVDIWFESGVTHLAVLGRDGMPWPADAYLEGSDQYRGWFRSNLITAVAIKGAPPYKAVVSTGWVVDAHGHAMHKSTGNYIGADDAMNTYGADVLRLWTASVEFAADMRLGDELLKSVSSVYRNLRYRLRMLLGLIDDLTPELLVAHDRLEPLDRLALASLDAFARKSVEAYKRYDLHAVYLNLIDYDAELSGFYIDLIKDRTYSSAPGALRRRSAQTALFRIFKTLVALLAPVLSFTAEEAWQHVPVALRGDAESVFDLELPPVRAAQGDGGGLGPSKGAPSAEADDLSLWETLKGLRAAVAAAEGARDFQLQATVIAPPELAARLAGLGDNLREALVVSALALREDPSAGAARVELAPAEGEKCARCWKYLPLGSDPEHPNLCAPCAQIVHELAEVPQT
jgi:isoleucyl-tRNA synthetase